MDQSRLWTRMTQWLKRGSATVGAQGLPRLGRDGLLEGVAPDAPGLPSDRPDGQVRRLSKQELREQALARLEDGHVHLVKLVETIRQHLESQDRQGQAIVQSLEDIGGHLSRVSQSVNKQTETLGAMSAQVQASGERTRRLEEALAGWPALAESQRDTLTLLAEQIGAERQSVDRIGESVQAYGGALSSLERSTTDAVVTVRSLHGASMRVEEQIAAIGRRQTRWLVMLFGATAAVAVLAAVLTLVALFR